MRRPASRLFAPLLSLAAVLLAGAAVFASPGRASACSILILPQDQAVEQARVIVLARVEGRTDQTVTLLPEAYLKGPLNAGSLTLTKFPAHEQCDFPEFPEGGRVLAILDAAPEGLAWPYRFQLFVLEDGRAFGPGGEDRGTEAELIREVRALTGQYAVPAASEDEGAGIDWAKTVLPVGGALVVIFIVSLALMRLWHKIDPS